MKTTHPLIRAETSKKEAATTSAREDPEPIIRLRIDKPLNWAWELTTSADALPIIQLLNKDGRLLLETCNKTAQRARGSFKDGLESLETFPEDVGSGRCRNVDGFSTKFGGNFQTRRSKSSPDVRKRRKEKRLSSIIDESGRKDGPEDEQRSTGGRRGQRRLGHSASGDLAVVEAEPARDVGNDLEIVKSFLREKLRQKMNQETERLRKTPSEGVIREAMTPEASYRTRRIRSATNVNASQQESVDKGSPGGSGKRKAYRKTKSDVILAKMGESLDSDRLSEDERMERSWREYKERKKLERMGCREVADEEEDFMSKPRWKDWQRPGSCQVGNCRVCQNMELKGCQEGDGSRSDLRTSSSFSSCSLPRLRDFNNVARKYWKPEVEVSRSFRSARKSPSEATLGLSYGTSTSSLARTTDVEANDRPGTDLQENYLLVEHPESETKDDDDGGGGGGSPDFGYDTISRQASATSTAYRGFYGNTKVGKSETFKVIDGSEGGGDDGAIGYRVGSGGKAEFSAAAANEDIARDYFKRVYELLKQRQEEQKEKSREAIAGGALEDNTSSSSYVPQPVKRKRWKRDRKSETVTEKAPPTSLRSNVEWKEPQQRPLAEPTKSGAVQSLPRTRDASVGAKCPKRPAPPPPPPPPHSAPAIASKLETNQDDAYETIEGTCDQNETQDGGNMGSNLSRHSGKGLSGRRTQSSGDLCEPSGKKSDMDRIGNARTSMKRGRYKFCGSLPNHLDDKDSSQEESKENNNVISLDSLTGTFSSTKVEGTKFFDSGESPLDTLDLVRHRAESSYDEADPWRYREDSDMHLDLVRSKHSVVPVASKSLGKSRQPSDQETGRKRSIGSRKESSGSEGGQKQCCHHRKADLDLLDTLERGKSRGYGDGATKESRVKFATDVPGTPKASEPRGRKSGAQGLDLTLNKGEPLDQGYSSERSPEVEHPPDLNASQPFPNITPEDTFRVTLQKTSRGLGFSVSGGGTSGPVRVNRLFPQQPAALSKMLQPGDILLAANGIPLTGLTNYEALEVLRTTANVVELVVCRMPGEGNPTPPGTPPPPPARRERPSSLRCPPPLPPPLLLMEPCGEFDIEMTKVAGSLGFTLRKVDSSVLGHYVRALVREPALSDGRIQPGDKIVAVDGVLLSPMSHEEAVQLLRQCGPKVKLRLYRDLAQTPVSALSPTETDKTFNPPRLNLRQEAVDMLCDLAVRKLSPAISSNSSCKSLGGSALAASRTSPRKLAKRHGSRSTDLDLADESVTKVEPNTVTSETSDSSSLPSSLRRTNLSDPFPPEIIFQPEGYDVTDDGISTSSRPNFLDLSLAQGKPCFFFNNRSDGSRIHVGTMHGDGNGNGDGNDVTDGGPAGKLQADAQYLAEPVSMPPVLSTEEDKENAGFSYKNPVYQSANPTCTAVDSSNRKAKTTCLSEQNIPGVNDATGSKSLLKWKGVMFTTSEKNEQELEENSTVPTPIPDSGSTPSGVATGVSGTDTSATFVTDSDTISNADEQNNEVFMVELTRGWNSRLGFSLQAEDGRTVVSVVHPDSIAAKDGRLKEGDVIIMVNDESVEEMTTQEIIDLLRKIRGSIGITVMRRRKAETPPEATT